jgi:flagellar biosynthesis protein FlhB
MLNRRFNLMKFLDLCAIVFIAIGLTIAAAPMFIASLLLRTNLLLVIIEGLDIFWQSRGWKKDLDIKDVLNEVWEKK